MGTVGIVFFFQAEDGIRDLVRSRGLGDVYKRQLLDGHHIGVKLQQLLGKTFLFDGTDAVDIP